jgi:signal transduction histidine kinase/ActR/RegA family two-component response regulator
MLIARSGHEGGAKVSMRPEDFRPDDLFAQIHSLVEGLAEERAARQAAEAADKAKSDLLAMIGHELRAPMESIVGMSELLLASPLEPTQARYVDTLYRSARSLLAALNDVLDFARLESGRFELAQSSFDLYELIRSVGTVLQTRAGEKGLTGGVDVGANCPQFVNGDARRLRQVLLSLVENALRFTAHGSVRLHISASDQQERTLLRFDITDTGVGLSKAVKDVLFHPYVQVDSKVAGNGNTGLGLSIAQKLALLMGGEIGCESAVGQGTHYWLVVPVERTRLAAAPAEACTKDAPPQGTLSGHVLVVENNAVNRMLILTYLDEFGLSHEVVPTGEAAILSLATKTYDLVLMDTTMSDLDGVEAARRIRNLHAPSSQVPIVALIAHGRTADCGAYLAAGMDAYVTKPIRGRELYAALAPFFGGGSAKEEPILRLVKG